MIRGIEKGKYLVFTSRDVRVGWYAQRYLPYAYNRAMRIANKKIGKLLKTVSTTAEL